MTEYGDPDVNAIIDTFQEYFGTTKATKYDRFAAKRLAKKHTAKTVCEVIMALSQTTRYKFAPVVNSVSQLENKWVSVIRYLTGTMPQEVEL